MRALIRLLFVSPGHVPLVEPEESRTPIVEVNP